MDKRKSEGLSVQSANIAKLSNEGILLRGARNRKPVPGHEGPSLLSRGWPTNPCPCLVCKGWPVFLPQGRR